MAEELQKKQTKDISQVNWKWKSTFKFHQRPAESNSASCFEINKVHVMPSQLQAICVETTHQWAKKSCSLLYTHFTDFQHRHTKWAHRYAELAPKMECFPLGDWSHVIRIHFIHHVCTHKQGIWPCLVSAVTEQKNTIAGRVRWNKSAASTILQDDIVSVAVAQCDTSWC